MRIHIFLNVAFKRLEIVQIEFQKNQLFFEMSGTNKNHSSIIKFIKINILIF